MIRAVLPFHVFQDLAAAMVGEVHIDIGGGRALRVQEALERQVVVQRVHGDDADGVGHQRAGGRASGGQHDPLLARPRTVIGHDEEVRGVAFLLDDVELVIQTVDLDLVQFALQEDRQAFERDLSEIVDGGQAVGNLIDREVPLAEFQFHVTTRRDLGVVLERLGDVLEGLLHLLRRGHRKVVVRRDGPLALLERAVVLDAQKKRARLGLFRFQIIDVPRRDDPHAELLRQRDERVVLLLLVRTVRLMDEFKEEVVFAENVDVFLHPLLGRLRIRLRQILPDIRPRTRQCDQTLAMLTQ